MTRSLSYHLRCRSEGEGKRQAGGERERGRTGGTSSTGSSSDGTEHTLNTLKSKLQLCMCMNSAHPALLGLCIIKWSDNA